MQIHHFVAIGPAILVGLCIIFAGVHAIRTGSMPQRNSDEMIRGPEAVSSGWACVVCGSLFVVPTILGGIYVFFFR